MVIRWFKRLFGTEVPDLGERRRIAAEHDRHRTDAIVAAERMKYGHRLDTPFERDRGRDNRS